MEFDKFAKEYGEYNIIQKKIIKENLKFVRNRVIDLGCGSEGLCKYKNFKFYLGIDKSENMLKSNPCYVKQMDFDKEETFEYLSDLDFEQIVSFSALQWSKDLKKVFKNIKNLNKEYLLAIFTSNTFKTLHNYLGFNSPIYSKEEILNYAEILNPNIKTLNYTLTFKTPIDMLNYIKFSGVRKGYANVARLKKFIKNYPFNFLEFEVIVLKSCNHLH